MARRDRVIVRRGRAGRTSWLPALLVIGLLVVGGILLWMLLSGDDEGGAIEGGFLVGGALLRGLHRTAAAEDELPTAA